MFGANPNPRESVRSAVSISDPRRPSGGCFAADRADSRRFPSPHGEWIQRLDRHGRGIDNIAAMPVKDPFHLARSLIHCSKVLEQLAARNTHRLKNA